MRTLLVALPGLVLAGIGLTHPHHLDASTAQWWRDMHIILAVVFPLLGAAQWVLLNDAPRYVRDPGRIAAFGYVVFYGALDALAGIGGGALAIANGGRSPADAPVFKIGNQLGTVGAWCFFRRQRRDRGGCAGPAPGQGDPGRRVPAAGSYLFLSSHIYWPKGVIACACIAIGMAATGYASASGRSVIEDSTLT